MLNHQKYTTPAILCLHIGRRLLGEIVPKLAIGGELDLHNRSLRPPLREFEIYGTNPRICFG
jgi:hypothetical protein